MAPPPTIAGIVAAKRLVRRKMARQAARKYTWVWNQVMKEQKGIDPKTNNIPPGFLGANKHAQAKLYENRIVNYALAHPKRYPTLYRGISGWEAREFIYKDVVRKTTLSSFSKSIKVAKEFSTIDYILELEGNQNLPAINFTTGYFQSEWGPGGKKYKNLPQSMKNKNEREVLLPPGTFTVKDRFWDHWNNVFVITVDYTPDKVNTSYLHRVPQVYVKTPPRIYTGKRGGIYTISKSGKKVYHTKLKKHATK